MDQRVKDFIGHAVNNVVGLDVALFFQANPSTFDTAAGLSLRLHRSSEEIQPALDRLIAAGALESVEREEGRYHVYSLSKDREIWQVLCLLSEEYLEEPGTRKEIVRLLVHQPAPEARSEEPEPL